MPGTETILAYDSDCLLCNRSIRFIYSQDPHGRIKFTPLQSALGKEFRLAIQQADLSTMIVRTGKTYLTKIAAVTHLLNTLGGIWRIPALILQWIPGPFSNAIYNQISKNRHHLNRDSCETPPPGLQARILQNRGPNQNL